MRTGSEKSRGRIKSAVSDDGLSRSKSVNVKSKSATEPPIILSNSPSDFNFGSTVVGSAKTKKSSTSQSPVPPAQSPTVPTEADPKMAEEAPINDKSDVSQEKPKLDRFKTIVLLEYIILWY